MNNGESVRIFKDIDNPRYFDTEKAIAVYDVLGMETHNGITKADLLKVCRWLFDQHFEIVKRGDDNV